eukprot:165967-Chlamydomonas_euryale.AAC.2
MGWVVGGRALQGGGDDRGPGWGAASGERLHALVDVRMCGCVHAWTDESERDIVVAEKRARGGAARATRDARKATERRGRAAGRRKEAGRRRETGRRREAALQTYALQRQQTGQAATAPFGRCTRTAADPAAAAAVDAAADANPPAVVAVATPAAAPTAAAAVRGQAAVHGKAAGQGKAAGRTKAGFGVADSSLRVYEARRQQAVLDAAARLPLPDDDVRQLASAAAPVRAAPIYVASAAALGHASHLLVGPTGNAFGASEVRRQRLGLGTAARLPFPDVDVRRAAPAPAADAAAAAAASSPCQAPFWLRGDALRAYEARRQQAVLDAAARLPLPDDDGCRRGAAPVAAATHHSLKNHRHNQQLKQHHHHQQQQPLQCLKRVRSAEADAQQRPQRSHKRRLG